MLGFKNYDCAATTIAGIELLHRIRKGQFAFGQLRLKDTSATALWTQSRSLRNSVEDFLDGRKCSC
jgi:hypothetical protein